MPVKIHLLENGKETEARNIFERILPFVWYEDQSLEFYIACEKFLLRELGVFANETVRRPGETLADKEKEELLTLYHRAQAV